MDEVVRRARALVGTPFRLHGRGRGGLDCVGLVAEATGRPAPTGYRRREGREGVERGLRAAGLAAREDGPVLLCAAGPGQWHLGIADGTGVIHACATAGRVVARADCPWVVVGRWGPAPRRQDDKGTH